MSANHKPKFIDQWWPAFLVVFALTGIFTIILYHPVW
jgi:hypothetical protein